MPRVSNTMWTPPHGKASEIEVFNARGEHLGTINPDGSAKGGP